MDQPLFEVPMGLAPSACIGKTARSSGEKIFPVSKGDPPHALFRKVPTPDQHTTSKFFDLNHRTSFIESNHSHERRHRPGLSKSVGLLVIPS